MYINAAYGSVENYPACKWLLGSGASSLNGFLEFSRQHMQYTPVFYSAYPQTDGAQPDEGPRHSRSPSCRQQRIRSRAAAETAMSATRSTRTRFSRYPGHRAQRLWASQSCTIPVAQGHRCVGRKAMAHHTLRVRSVRPSVAAAKRNFPAPKLTSRLPRAVWRSSACRATRLRPFHASFRWEWRTPERSRRLGDVGACAPENWQFGGPNTPAIDLLVMLYAVDQAVLESISPPRVKRFAGIQRPRRNLSPGLDTSRRKRAIWLSRRHLSTGYRGRRAKSAAGSIGTKGRRISAGLCRRIRRSGAGPFGFAPSSIPIAFLTPDLSQPTRAQLRA